MFSQVKTANFRTERNSRSNASAKACSLGCFSILFGLLAVPHLKRRISGGSRPNFKIKPEEPAAINNQKNKMYV
jgi:hypothetical protein